MPGDLGTFAVELTALSTRLKLAAEGGLTRELRDSIGDAMDPVMRDIREQLPEHIPVGGGYAAAVDASLDLRAYRRLGFENAAVTLIGSNRGIKQRRLRRLNAGMFNHPLFGDRQRWYTEATKQPLFFDGPALAAAPRVRDAIASAMHDIAERVMHG